MNGENRCFAVAETCFLRKKNVLDYHLTFGRSICAVVDGAEGRLRTCTAVHGVKVMNQRLHRLIGCAVGFVYGKLAAVFLYLCGFLQALADKLSKIRQFLCAKFVFVRQYRYKSVLSQLVHICVYLFGDAFKISACRFKAYRTDNILAVKLLIGLFDAICHCVVKVWDRLTAVLVVLVRLDRNAGKR